MLAEDDYIEMKTVYILRSVSGAGKSTLADELIKGRNGIICCADDFLYNSDGVYDFSLAAGGANHLKCQAKFLQALSDDVFDVIVVANTNTKASDWKFYAQEAAKYDATVFYLVVENRHGGKDIHNVPESVLETQEQRVRQSLKLR